MFLAKEKETYQAIEKLKDEQQQKDNKELARIFMSNEAMNNQYINIFKELNSYESSSYANDILDANWVYNYNSSANPAKTQYTAESFNSTQTANSNSY